MGDALVGAKAALEEGGVVIDALDAGELMGLGIELIEDVAQVAVDVAADVVEDLEVSELDLDVLTLVGV